MGQDPSGSREIWVEDKYRASPRRNFGGGLLGRADVSGSLSERPRTAQTGGGERASRVLKARRTSVVGPAFAGVLLILRSRLLAARAVARRSATSASAAGTTRATSRRCEACAGGGFRRGSRQAGERQDGHLQVGGGVRDRRRSQAGQHGRHRGAHEFLTGIADDVGIQPGKAGGSSRANAARTRAELLQAGAELRRDEQGAAMMSWTRSSGCSGCSRRRLGARSSRCGGPEAEAQRGRKAALYVSLGKSTAATSRPSSPRLSSSVDAPRAGAGT